MFNTIPEMHKHTKKIARRHETGARFFPREIGHVHKMENKNLIIVDVI